MEEQIKRLRKTRLQEKRDARLIKEIKESMEEKYIKEEGVKR